MLRGAARAAARTARAAGRRCSTGGSARAGAGAGIGGLGLGGLGVALSGWAGSPAEAEGKAGTAAAPLRELVDSVKTEDGAVVDDTLDLFTLDDVRRHRSPDSMWVTYNGIVYDVTDFIDHHPGGRDLIVTAGGLDLGAFFSHYTIHTKSDKAQNWLDGYVIGRLSEGDAQKALDTTTVVRHMESRKQVLGGARRWLYAVLATAPMWLFIRLLLRVAAVVCPPLARIAGVLPVSVPGLLGAAKLPAVDGSGRRGRVAVIGGGIAGCTCAYGLTESGYDVTLYEAREEIGGNAKNHEWTLANGETASSAVAVVAFHDLQYNYRALCGKLGIEWVKCDLGFWIRCTEPGMEGDCWTRKPELTRGDTGFSNGVSLHDRFEKDFERYDKAVRFVTKVNSFFSSFSTGGADSTPSLYRFSVLNPLTFIPLPWVMKAYGVSDDFWNVIMRSYHASTFMTNKLECTAATVLETMDEVIPCTPKPPTDRDPEGRVVPRLNTWKDSGAGITQLYGAMTSKAEVKKSTRVLKVNCDGPVKKVSDEFGGTADFDRVVFACPSNAVGNMLQGHSWVEDTLLRSTEYADDLDFSGGHMNASVHEDCGVLPEKVRTPTLEHASNYIEVKRDPATKEWQYEQTYTFSALTNKVRELPVEQRPAMLITHGLYDHKSIDPKLNHRAENHARAHTIYSIPNMITMALLHLIQGRRGVYFCSNYTVPGNCQDLSTMSGLAVASAIGAEYPFKDNSLAKRDFDTIKMLMGL